MAPARWDVGTPPPLQPASPGTDGHIPGLLPTGLASGLVLANGW